MNAPPTLVDAWYHHALAEAKAADLKRPGVVVWFGAATRHWWAAIESRSGRWHLVEARGLGDLRRMIDSVAGSAPTPLRPRTSRRHSPGGRHARQR